MSLSDKQKWQVSECIRRAKAHWGAGWANLSEDMRQAYIARECLQLFLGQDESCQTPACFARLIAVSESALGKVEE